MTDVAVGTRHLVDPELLPGIDLFPRFGFETLSLQEIRAGLAERASDQALASGTAVSIPGPPGAPDVRVLVYEPVKRVDPAPALIWMHGGGFMLGTAADDEVACRRMADETGAVVLSVEYRLAPETRAPGAVEDCYAVLRWLHTESGSLRVDPGRIAVGGASAGGGLAACLSILARDRAELSVSFQLLIYPALDDRTGSTTDLPSHLGEFVWNADDTSFAWSALIGDDPGGPDVSPYTAAARVSQVAGLPPAFIGVGSLDLFVPENVRYAQRLVEAGIPTELHVYPGAYHGFDLMPDATVTANLNRDVVGALRRHFEGR